MYFNRTRKLTGLLSFTMAAAIAAAPVNAMGMTVHSERKNKGLRSSYTVALQNAQAELVLNALDSMARSGSEKIFSSARQKSLQMIVGKTFLSAGKTELAVAAPNAYLNIHADASLGSEIVGRMYGNDVAKILRNDGSGWSRVESGEVVGYVLSEYLVEGDEARMIAELVGTEVDSDNNGTGDIQDDSGTRNENKTDGTEVSSVNTVKYVYPVAESSEEIEERRENGTVKDAADEAQEKADTAAKVAQEAQEKADEIQDLKDQQQETPQSDSDNTEESESDDVSEADEKQAEMAQTVAEITQKTADAAQESADEAREEMRSHGAESGEAVAQFALQYVGNPYVWGGSSLTNGTDCSGFTMAVYANFGVSLPHYDASQRSYGIAIDSLSDARAGDLICYYGHVGIYIGDGMIVHAANARDGIKVSRADYRQIAAIRRIFY